MPANIREVLNADQMTVALPCVGLGRAGFGLTGTWVGTANFEVSFDGATFIPVTVRPFASGNGVKTATGNGNWELDLAGALAVRVRFTRTSGSLIVTIAASLDAAYQDAFLASTSLYIAQSHAAGGANVVTVAAQANRAWRLRTLSIGWSAAPGAAVLVTISDGGSSTIWETYAPATAGDNKINLPDDPRLANVAGGGVAGTPGNSFVITVADPGGSVVSKINAELIAA